MSRPSFVKLAAIAFLPLFVAACFFMPGKFVSNLNVDKNGQFNFAYKGEIIAMSGDDMMGELGKSSDEDEEFIASCSTDDGEERDCTAKETAEQKKEWDAAKPERDKARADKKKEDAEKTAMLMGFDPNDPKSVDAFIAKLTKQKGWNSVVHKGHGVFDVDYAISGSLDHNFSFPNIPDAAMAVPMVELTVRKDGSVAVAAPGFGLNEEQSRSKSLMGAAMADAAKEGNAPAGVMDGTFTVTTNGEVLTNNTEDGPTSSGKTKSMTWKVTPQSTRRPETLIRLDKR